MDGAERAGVAGIDRPKEADRLGSAKFANHQAVWTKAKRGLEQILHADAGFAHLPFDCDQPEADLALEADFGCVLDQDHPFRGGHFAQEGVEEGRLARTCPTADQDRAPVGNRLDKETQRLGHRVDRGNCLTACKRSRCIGGQGQVDQPMAADCHRPALAGRGRRNELNPRAVGKRGGEQWAFPADPLMRGPGNLFGKPPDQEVVHLGRFDPLEMRLARSLDPDLSRGVDDDFGNILAVEPPAERTQIGGEIDPSRLAQGDYVRARQAFLRDDHYRAVPTCEKSRSRAVKTRIG